MGINEPSPEIAAWHSRWKIIRDVVAGEHAIKSGRESYLPRSRTGQTDCEYERWLKVTPFFPATSRTAQGNKGLMFAKNVVLNAPILESIAHVLTPDGLSFRDLADEVVWQTQQTNYTGLLVDHPSVAGAELNAANALELGSRPFIHLYAAEAILETTYGVVRNRRLLVKVRLLESANSVLVLELINGIYRQTVWTKDETDSWSAKAPTIPRRDGQPLNEIPFVIVSDNTKAQPQASVLEDIARLNLNHYIAQGRIAALEMYGSGVVPVITGMEPEKGPDGKAIMPELFMGPGGFIILPSPDAKAFFLEPAGNMASQLNTSKKDLEEQMAKVGARMLAPERVAPEAVETVRMRSAAEDSTRASLAQLYARRISEALGWCAWWMGGERTDAALTLNTDYQNKGLTAQDRTVAMAELQAGLRSHEDWFYERRDAGLINSSLTFEAEQARIEQDALDRPSAGL